MAQKPEELSVQDLEDDPAYNGSYDADDVFVRDSEEQEIVEDVGHLPPRVLPPLPAGLVREMPILAPLRQPQAPPRSTVITVEDGDSDKNRNATEDNGPVNDERGSNESLASARSNATYRVDSPPPPDPAEVASGATVPAQNDQEQAHEKGAEEETKPAEATTQSDDAAPQQVTDRRPRRLKKLEEKKKPPKASATVSDVFIQQTNSFRRARRAVFERMLAEAGEQKPDLHRIPVKYLQVISAALSFQSSFHNFSLILQGLTFAHAVFAFVFADTVVLYTTYRYMCIPVHAWFYVCFVISTICAWDRLETTGWADRGHRGVTANGALGVGLWSIGTVASLLSMPFEDKIFEATDPTSITVLDLRWWRWLSAVRASAALVAWFLLALSPNANFLRETVERFAIPEDEREDDSD